MKKADFQALVDEAAALQTSIAGLRKKIAEKSERLESVKLLIAAAVPAQTKIETTPTDGGGKSYHLAAASGVPIRVTQPAPQLLRTFGEELIEQLQGLAGSSFSKLFEVKYSCVPNFRTACVSALPCKLAAAKIIALCEIPSKAAVKVG